MWALDASSIIYAWDNYPKDQFPKLWNWLGGLAFIGEISIPSVAHQEVSHKTPECGKWLDEIEIPILHPNTKILLCATRLKEMLEIQGDKYGAGDGENDLIRIATAESNGLNLISNEKVQFDLPKVLSKYKIPAVCSKKKPPTICIDFLEFIKRSKSTF